MPLEAAEMALLRVIHASEMPDPGALLETLATGEAVPATSRAASSATEEQGSMLKAPSTFAGIVDLLTHGGKPHMAHMLHAFVAVVHYEPPALTYRPPQQLAADFALTPAERRVGKEVVSTV